MSRRVVGIDTLFTPSEIKLNERLVPVVGAATSLPIRDNSCDYVVCVDTFEHMGPDDRPGAVLEMLRVVKPGGRFFVAFPSGDPARHFDQTMANWFEVRHRPVLHWLEEHRKLSLPTRADFTAWLESGVEKFGYRLDIREDKNVNMHLQRLYMSLLLNARNSGVNLLLRATVKLLAPLLCHLNFGRCYRRTFLIKKLRRSH